MSRRIIEHDWSGSLGPLATWPASLKVAVGLIVHSPVPMVLLLVADGVMIYNDAYSVFAGGRHPQLLGAKVREGWPEVADFNDNVMKVGLSGGTLAYRDQELTLCRSGKPEQAWMNLDYSPVMDESGRPGGVIAIVVETTDRVLSERRLQAASLRQQRQFEQAPGFIIVMSGPEHLVEFVNESHRSVFGSADWVGKTIRDAFPSIAGQGFYEMLDNVYRTGVAFTAANAETRYEKTPGDGIELRYLSFVYAPLSSDDGSITGVFCEGFDVTETHLEGLRRDALSALTERLRDIDDLAEIAGETAEVLGETLGASRVGYGTLDRDEQTLHVERSWTAPGWAAPPNTIRLSDYGDAVDALRRGEFVAIRDVRQDPRTATVSEALEAWGIRSWLNVPVLEQGRLVAVLFVNDARARDWSPEDLAFMDDVAARTRAVIERARSQAALRDSEENFRTLALALPNHVWTATPDGRLDWFNQAVLDYNGTGEHTPAGDGWTRFVHPDDLAAAAGAWARAIASSKTYEVEFRLLRHDGAWRWHIGRAVAMKDDSGGVTRWVGTNTDIHDQKEVAATLADLNAHLELRVDERTAELVAAQEALRQAQKMEAVGQLTGGIAHDFNNLLAGIIGSLELLERRLADGRSAGVERYIDAAQGSARRAAALTQRLLAFSRRQTLDPKPIDVNKLIGGMEELIRRTIGPNVELEVVGAGGLWTTRVDPSQLENALLNLCINARDAMAPAGGRLTVETANKWLDDRAAKQRDLPPGQYVSLCVTDTGTGMTPEVVERAFDPFFTTKPLGQGTGLGLSMIYGFVRQSGGQVRIYSELGKGTTMCLYLPRHAGNTQEPDQRLMTEVHIGHGETVLVIDDEAIVRMLIVDVLAENGYAVLEADDGPSGLKVLQSGARIDLLITDVGLPGGMNGRQIADAARVAHPGLKVLFITGYAENAVVGNGHLDRCMEVITKPFDTAALGNKVRELIDRPT